MRSTRSTLTTLALTSVIACTATLTGCGGGSGQTRAREVTPTFQGAPSVLRGTIGYETRLRRAEPTYISGFGLVVGLDGTGSTNVPESVAATMEKEISRMADSETGGFANTPFEGMTPREIIRHPDTAIVLVEAGVPAGAPEGTTFDVQVRALSSSTTESLEGGKLWTTYLQIGPASTLGGLQTRQIAEARGEVFINPFTTPGAPTELNTRVGRILGGGIITEPQPLELLLETPLHSRAQAISRAVNQRFPDGPGGQGTTARGRDDQVIQVFAPPAYKDKFEDFVQLLLYTPINQNFPEQLARRYAQAMIQDPSAADELSWALRSIGQRAIPFVRDLYKFPEQGPRMAALRAGAHLGDTYATAALELIALDPDAPGRLEAIELLGIAHGHSSVERTLHDLLRDEEELTIRATAYEALMERARREQLEQLIALNGSKPAGQRVSLEQLLFYANARIPRGNRQGVERLDIGGRFHLDIVPFGEPMVYVTQQGHPRIAIIGENTDLQTPLFVAAWDDRLLMTSSESDQEIRLRYQMPRNGPIITSRVDSELAELIQYMARGASATDPRRGLGLTYSEVVGALAAIQDSGATKAAFATENDRLIAGILEASKTTVQERPALEGDTGEAIELDPLAEKPRERPAGERDRPTYVVPLKIDDEEEGSAGGSR